MPQYNQYKTLIIIILVVSKIRYDDELRFPLSELSVNKKPGLYKRKVSDKQNSVETV
jgi:hypothetical protein